MDAHCAISRLMSGRPYIFDNLRLSTAFRILPSTMQHPACTVVHISFQNLGNTSPHYCIVKHGRRLHSMYANIKMAYSIPYAKFTRYWSCLQHAIHSPTLLIYKSLFQMHSMMIIFLKMTYCNIPQDAQHLCWFGVIYCWDMCIYIFKVRI